MFHSARLKLTTWYLVIIMMVSIIFSFFIYSLLSQEIDRAYQRLAFRIERQQEIFGTVERSLLPELENLQAAKNRILWRLIYLNMAIFGISGILGYFLAGKTLRPIQDMVDTQHQFITDASHELRTPLTALITSMEVHLRDPKFTFEEAKALLKSNLEEVKSLHELSEGLLELTGPTNGGNLQISPVSMGPIITESIRRLSPLAKKKHVEIETNVSDVTIEADEKKILELFTILLDNAIKYSYPHGKVLISTKKEKQDVRIVIVDSGIGIAPDDISHIFDRFYRADNSRSKEEATGFGLGLAIAKAIVDAHNGSIDVKSSLGKGTTFVIRLPAF